MTSQTYNLDGPKEFPFPYPVRSADQLTVEIVPGAAVAPGDYEVVGVGPTSTQVTVRYPNAPTSGGLQLKITRYVAPERVTQIDSPSDINVTNLNAEFNNVYEAMVDLEATVLQQVQDELDAFQDGVLDPAVATTVQARDDALAARDAAQAAETGAGEKWDDFRDRYWGAYASDPSESPVGRPPDAGDLYFNTTASEWRVWNGTAWQQPDTKIPSVYDRRDYVASGGTLQHEEYTATEGQTFYAFPYNAPDVLVFVPAWGELVEGVDYTYEQGVGVTLIPGASLVPDPVPGVVAVYISGTVPETFPVNYDPPFVQVWVNGALLPPSDYTADSGSFVVPNDPLPEDTEVTVIGISGASATELGALVDLILATPNFVAYTDEIEGHVAAASASASAAASSASDASDSAAASASSASAAAGSATTAAAQASNAEDSASAAAGSATAAATSASNASDSAAAASSSAGAASTSASEAAASASDASTSATNAGEAETGAVAAQSAAASSASDAADSATAAAGSADEAQGYAQDAQDALVAEPRILRAFGSLNTAFRDSSLWLDFKAQSWVSAEANGDKYTRVYSDVLTLSSPSPKWVWNAQGQLVEIPAGQPAYDHDPVTGEPLGQRLEYSSTNVLLRNTALDTWNNAGTEVQVTAGQIAPDGTPTAFQLSRIPETPGRLTQFTGVPFADGETYTCSFWVYGLDDPETYSYRIYMGGAYHRFDDQVVVGEWRKIEITAVTTTSNNAFQFNVPMCVLWLPQVEQGPVATSPIITEASAVTRAADALDVDAITGGVDRGSILVRCHLTEGAPVLAFDGTALVTAPDADWHTYVISYDGTETLISIDGADATTGAGITPSLPLNVFRDSSSAGSGYIEDLVFSPIKKTAAQVKAASAAGEL